jgi:dTDP-glucose 4,6-dehydratase
LLDWAKIRRELGWAPALDVEDALERTIDWYRENEAWWRRLLERPAVDEEAWAGTR